MSGFKDDVLAILRDNVMLHGEAIGFIPVSETFKEGKELLDYLIEEKFPVTGKSDKVVTRFDYIVLSKNIAIGEMIIKSMGLLNLGGLLIIDITKWDRSFWKNYKSVFASFTATLVKYNDRAYLVLHTGADYGN